MPPTSTADASSPPGQTLSHHPAQPAHWTEAIPNAEFCANCGQPRTGDFCAACGQRHLKTRLRLWPLIKQVSSMVFNVDRGLFHTFLNLLRRPGGVAKDYIRGKQRPYVNPLTYIFIGAALQMVSLFFNQSFISEGMQDSLNQLQELPPYQKPFADLESKIGDVPTAFSRVYISSLQQGYSYAALIFFCFPFAVLLMAFHSMRGEQFKLGETSVFALFMVGHMLVITAFVTTLSLRLAPAAMQSLVGPLMYFLIAMHGHTGFFQSTWISRLATTCALGLSTIIFVCSILGIFMVSLVVFIAFQSIG